MGDETDYFENPDPGRTKLEGLCFVNGAAMWMDTSKEPAVLLPVEDYIAALEAEREALTEMVTIGEQLPDEGVPEPQQILDWLLDTGLVYTDSIGNTYWGRLEHVALDADDPAMTGRLRAYMETKAELDNAIRRAPTQQEKG